ncbi:hypothetical protein LJC34_05530 [Oscillospiraceae bacterium OttesenSCG-928-G22]|nr:hypothetical protein [Oscillospiraceae bacterium OttesenSCG-928-G22]
MSDIDRALELMEQHNNGMPKKALYAWIRTGTCPFARRIMADEDNRRGAIIFFWGRLEMWLQGKDMADLYQNGAQMLTKY